MTPTVDEFDLWWEFSPPFKTPTTNQLATLDFEDGALKQYVSEAQEDAGHAG